MLWYPVIISEINMSKKQVSGSFATLEIERHVHCIMGYDFPHSVLWLCTHILTHLGFSMHVEILQTVNSICTAQTVQLKCTILL